MGAGSSAEKGSGDLKIKIREISNTNIAFFTERTHYHYSIHPDRAPFLATSELDQGAFDRLNANTFYLPDTSEETFRYHLANCNINTLEPERVIEYFEGLGLKNKQDIWSFIKTVLKVLGGLAAIGNGILMIADK